MKIHKLAKYFPLLEGEEFDALVDDIKQHGQLEPIVTVNDEILDGVNRYNACVFLGMECLMKAYDGDDPLSYVISANIKRRHMTESQRAMLATEILPEYEKQAREHSLANLKHSGIGHEPAPSSVSKVTIDGPPGRSTTKVSKAFGVSHGSVARAKRIKRQAPERVDDIISGRATVTAIDEELRQAKAVERATENKTKATDKATKEQPKFVKAYLAQMRQFKKDLEFVIECAKRTPLAPEAVQFITNKQNEIENLFEELEDYHG